MSAAGGDVSHLEDPLREVLAAKESRQRQQSIEAITEVMDPEGLASLTTLMLDPELQTVAHEVAVQYFVRRGEASDEWADEFAGWLASGNIAAPAALPLISDVSWALRGHGRSPLCVIRLADLVSTVHPSRATEFKILIYLQAARFDFNFEAIQRALTVLPQSSKSIYPQFFEAIGLFADYGSNKLSASARPLEIAESTNDSKVLHVIAHALWFSSQDRDCHSLIAVTNRLLAINEADAVARFRQSTAYRRLGDFESASQTIRVAVATSDPSRVEINDMLIEEFQRVLIQRDLAQTLADAAAKTSADLTRRIEDAEVRVTSVMDLELERVRNSTADTQFKMVEILGLFTALIAIGATVIASSGAAGLEWWQRLAVIAGGIGGTLLFFIILRLIVRPSRK